MVQLKDNQTLIIAGLILHQKTTYINKVPYIGDVPYLGGLFRTTSYNNTETGLRHERNPANRAFAARWRLGLQPDFGA